MTFPSRMGKKELDPRISEISKKIRSLRVEAGFTSYESFANAKGLPRMQYWRAETGANMTLTTLLKILDAHSISLEAFFRDMG